MINLAINKQTCKYKIVDVFMLQQLTLLIIVYRVLIILGQWQYGAEFFVYDVCAYKKETI